MREFLRCVDSSTLIPLCLGLFINDGPLAKNQTTSEFTARVEDCVPLQKSSATFLTTNEREFPMEREQTHTHIVLNVVTVSCRQNFYGFMKRILLMLAQRHTSRLSVRSLHIHNTVGSSSS